jgi:hypothetical protein
MRYGDSHHEPPALRERFVTYETLPPIVRAMIPGVAPKLIAELHAGSAGPTAGPPPNCVGFTA